LDGWGWDGIFTFTTGDSKKNDETLPLGSEIIDSQVNGL